MVQDILMQLQIKSNAALEEAAPSAAQATSVSVPAGTPSSPGTLWRVATVKQQGIGLLLRHTSFKCRGRGGDDDQAAGRPWPAVAPVEPQQNFPSAIAGLLDWKFFNGTCCSLL